MTREKKHCAPHKRQRRAVRAVLQGQAEACGSSRPGRAQRCWDCKACPYASVGSLCGIFTFSHSRRRQEGRSPGRAERFGRPQGFAVVRAGNRPGCDRREGARPCKGRRKSAWRAGDATPRRGTEVVLTAGGRLWGRPPEHAWLSGQLRISFRRASPGTSCRRGFRFRPHGGNPCVRPGPGIPQSRRDVLSALPRPAARGRSLRRGTGIGTG